MPGGSELPGRAPDGPVQTRTPHGRAGHNGSLARTGRVATRAPKPDCGHPDHTGTYHHSSPTTLAEADFVEARNSCSAPCDQVLGSRRPA